VQQPHGGGASTAHSLLDLFLRRLIADHEFRRRARRHAGKSLKYSRSITGASRSDCNGSVRISSIGAGSSKHWVGPRRTARAVVIVVARRSRRTRSGVSLLWCRWSRPVSKRWTAAGAGIGGCGRAAAGRPGTPRLDSRRPGGGQQRQYGRAGAAEGRPTVPHRCASPAASTDIGRAATGQETILR